MTVHVVTDSTACLPAALAAEYGITVLDIHTRGKLRSPEAAGSASPASSPATSVSPSVSPVDGNGTVDDTDQARDQHGAGTGRAAADNSGSGVDGEAGEDAELTDGPAGGEQGVPAATTAGGETGGKGAGAGDSAGASAAGGGTDSPPDGAGERGDEEPTTAGLGPLELTAAYARLLERGGDDGVVALHLSRELSSTWSAAVQAAAVFDGLVEVLDTRSAGMVLGQAAVAAARRAADGADLQECTAAARRVLDGANVWLYVHRLDALARGGRLSTAQRLLSTALAIRPILRLSGGKIELAAKTRTQAKAMARLVTFAEDAYREAASQAATDAAEVADGTGQSTGEGGADAEGPGGRDSGRRAAAGVDDGPAGGLQASGKADGGRRGSADADAGTVEEVTETDTVPGPGDGSAPEDPGAGERAGEGSGEGAGEGSASDAGKDSDPTPAGAVAGAERPRVFTFGGDHEFRLLKRREEPVPLRNLPKVPMHLDIHQAGYPEIAEELRDTLRRSLPECVVISVVDLSPALQVHTGPEAVGITLVHG